MAWSEASRELFEAFEKVAKEWQEAFGEDIPRMILNLGSRSDLELLKRCLREKNPDLLLEEIYREVGEPVDL